MPLQSRCSNHCVDIIKRIIASHQRLFVEEFLWDSPEIQAIVDQMIHGKPHHKSTKLYQYLVESFLLAGGGDESNQGYYAKQKVKPTFNRVKRALQAAQCPKLVSFEAFAGCGYQKSNQPAGNQPFWGAVHSRLLT